MSIEKVEITNAQGDLLVLTLEDISNGFIVRDIGGLDPVKATIATSSFAGLNGKQKHSVRREERNITFELGYAPNYDENQTVRSLRSRLYEFFDSGIDVSLTFYMTDETTVVIEGTVESCEAPLFSREPQMNVSILCFDPDFVDPNLVQIHSLFSTADTTPYTINVDGTAKTGLTSLKFTVQQASLGDFAIYHTTPAGVLRTMSVSVPLLLHDVVEICTIPGQKSITLTRGGSTSSLLYAVSPQSDWVLLEHGANQFYLNAGPTNPSPVWVDYFNRYGGL